MNKDVCIEATTVLLTAMTQEKQAQADQLRAIVSLAHNYCATTASGSDDDLLDELVEDTVTGGSFGTPPISEFAAMELGPLMGASPAQAKTILFETLNLYHRHPSLWTAVQELALDAHRARKAAGRLGVLNPETADRVGKQWVKKQHRLSWQGAIDLCDKLIVAADPVIAAEREARQLRNRNVQLWEPHEATVNLTAKLDVLDGRYVDDTVSQIAMILRECQEYKSVAGDVLRSKALGILAHPALALAMLQEALQQPMFGLPGHDTTPTLQEPGRKGPGPQVPGLQGPGLQAPGLEGMGREGTGLVDEPGGAGVVVDPQTGDINPNPHHCLGHLCGQITVPVAKLQPRVQVYIHLNPEDGTADIEGIGTVAMETLRGLLDGKQVKVTPVIDLNHMPAEYQYRPSRRLRDATHLVFPKDVVLSSRATQEPTYRRRRSRSAIGPVGDWTWTTRTLSRNRVGTHKPGWVTLVRSAADHTARKRPGTGNANNPSSGN